MENKKRVILIAEAGVNHNGSLETAKKMAEAAKKAGADYVKFQTFVPRELVTAGAGTASYQKETDGASSQLELLGRLALPENAFRKLEQCCRQLGIGFLSTPFDFPSMDFLSSLSMDYWKVPSGELTNLPYLERIGRTRKRVLLSTGMGEMDEIRDAVGILEENGAPEITLLHCTTQYPASYADVNLLAMKQMETAFHKKTGYSDHTLGIEIPIAAAALGARVIEKHFTLDRDMKGPDHRASLEPEELAAMAAAVRNIEAALGDGVKRRTESEESNLHAARKSIVAAKGIKAGEIFTEENLSVKRPGEGISPMEWHRVLGKRSGRDYKQDELIQRDWADA